MRTHGKRGFRPQLEGIENRCLLSAAVLEIENQSTYNITFDFRWIPSSAWSQDSERHGQGVIFSTAYSPSLEPQAFYNTTMSAGSGTTVNLVQGYNQWFGTGTPPASAATLYEFQNTATGVGLSYVPPTPIHAVVEVQNQSKYNITFEFRWTRSSAWFQYSETHGQGEIFSTAYSPSLEPQAFYYTTTSAGSEATVNLVQGYNQWFGTGTPPASAAKLYEFQNTATGVGLDYVPPTPSPSYYSRPSWSGYVAATNLANQQANSVSAVSGSWIVPTVTGPSTGSTYSSIWVGIDGWNGNTVEQVGTEQSVVNGVTDYYAWWEMYSTGKGQLEQTITGMTVTPGDSITAGVQYITSGTYAGQFCLLIVDNSRDEYFSIYASSSQYQSPLAQRSCAEWIVEADDVGGSIQTLPNFGSVTFTNASAVINGVSGAINYSRWQSEALDIYTSGILGGAIQQDMTSVLTNTGTSFVVTGVNLDDAEAGTASGAAGGTTLRSGRKIAGPVLRGSAWTGASVVSGSRTPIRQHKRPTQGFLMDPLWN